MGDERASARSYRRGPSTRGRRFTIVTGRRVRRVVGAAAVLGLLLAVAVVATRLSLTHQIATIDGAFDGLADRPPGAAGETILLVGTRAGEEGDVPWLSGEQSPEALMLVEIGEDRTQVAVKSLPLDQSFDTAVRSASPDAAVAAAEAWSGRRVDHLMVIDWATFAELAAENGVDRTYRYGSSPPVQRDYLRDVLKGTLHVELRKDPLALYRQLSTTAAGLAIDDAWSFGELDRLLLSLRNLRSNDIDFSAARPG